MHESPSSPAAQPSPHSPTARSGPAADTVLYEERLTPAWWIWLVALMVSSLAILVFVPISLATGITAAVVMFVVLAILLVVSTPRIEVTTRLLRVGRATIEREHVGRVTGYRRDAATEQRGLSLHGLAYLCIRGWVDPVVRIQITDERDRTPYWLTSTRRPEQLVDVLGGAMHVPAPETTTAPPDAEDGDLA
ncbi:DUF3093 domain-containing protein [Micrococcus terreus]|uniref:DUF3093 domain-containing protein n=1 Tax=Micrococcus terreus TaxID=574650 RepID=UPI00301965EB